MQPGPYSCKLAALGEETMAGALEGVAPGTVEQMIGQLGTVKENLRRLIQQRHAHTVGERRYG